jgi:phosphonoacetaldehyde hydrolase
MNAMQKVFQGSLKTVILDLAGTVVDHGSCAPAGAFVELFRRHGVEITIAQARTPMGVGKMDHIRELIRMPEISEAWRKGNGAPCRESDIEAMYRDFIPLQIECLPRHCMLIDGALNAVDAFRSAGLKIGVTTGYNLEMMEMVLDRIARQGFVPDFAVCASQVPEGRPAPWMIYRCMEAFGAYPPSSVVAIGDTIADISAGLNAGVWTIGVARTGNMLGLNDTEIEALSSADLSERLRKAYGELHRAGAHYVVDGIYDCPHVIDDIQRKLGDDKRAEN